MWKFLDQGLIQRHSSDPSHCSDNGRSLTHWATRELPRLCFLNFSLYLFLWIVLWFHVTFNPIGSFPGTRKDVLSQLMLFQVAPTFPNTIYWVISFFFFSPHSRHTEVGVPGQILNTGHNCDFHHSCSNAESLTHCTTVVTPWIILLFLEWLEMPSLSTKFLLVLGSVAGPSILFHKSV